MSRIILSLVWNTRNPSFTARANGSHFVPTVPEQRGVEVYHGTAAFQNKPMVSVSSSTQPKQGQHVDEFLAHHSYRPCKARSSIRNPACSRNSAAANRAFLSFIGVVTVVAIGSFLRSSVSISIADILENHKPPPEVVRLVVISDTHGHHRELTIPPGDILIHAGDFSQFGTLGNITDFDAWLATLPHAHKVVIAGNHESHFMGSSTTVQDDYKTVQMLKVLLRSATFLSDSGTKILGLTIWGSPWQSQYANTGFFLEHNSSRLREAWAKIPTHVDILVTHTPPYGTADEGDMTGMRGDGLLKKETAGAVSFGAWMHVIDDAAVALISYCIGYTAKALSINPILPSQ